MCGSPKEIDGTGVAGIAARRRSPGVLRVTISRGLLWLSASHHRPAGNNPEHSGRKRERKRMTQPKFTLVPSALPGALIIEPRVFGDERGFFLESYTRRDMEAIGIAEEFVQDNHSRSAKGVLRGLHFQYPFPQSKLIRVVRGGIYDVIVDIRRGSPTYGRYEAFQLTGENHRILYVPVGFAHGFLALSDGTDILYKTGDYYHPEADAGIRWDDPGLSIPWPLQEYRIGRPTLSDKDTRLPLMSDLASRFTYREAEE